MKVSLTLALTATLLVLPSLRVLAAPVSRPASAPAATPAADNKPAIFVCGDSTSKFAGSETATSEMQGWGTPIAAFFDPAKVTVKNVGHAGTSSLSYYNGDWVRVLPQIKAGDYVLIVFGINDGTTPNGIGDEVVAAPPAASRGRGTATASAPAASAPSGPGQHTYGWYMSKMATDALAKGAHPFFLTVTTRNIWTNPKVKFTDATPQGDLPADYDPKLDKIERGTGGGRYTQWTKDVGKIHVPVFDLTNYCADQYEKMGRETVMKFYRDHNHTYAAGAKFVATSIASGLKAFKNSPFIPLLSEEGKALPTAEAKFVADNLPD